MGGSKLGNRFRNSLARSLLASPNDSAGPLPSAQGPDTAPRERRDVHRRLTTHILASRGLRYGSSRRGARLRIRLRARERAPHLARARPRATSFCDGALAEV